MSAFSFFEKFQSVIARLCALALCLFASSYGFTQLPEGFIREEIATGLNPTSMVIGKDGRIFITEKDGKIRIVRDDVLLDEALLTIEVDDSNERGLGHMVLHPDFENNGWIYIYYAVPLQRFNRVTRFQANGDKIIPGSEKVIIDMDQMGSDIHNGGDMVFGFDGYLYVSTGDGGRNWLGEDPGSTNAKILRMDDEGLAVPDNPMYGSTYGRSELVYAMGVRNPFTMIIHPLTGDIYVNDVGGAKFEEINRIERGAFYGWPRLEGKNTTGIEVPDGYMDPIHAYGHTNGYCCIVGSAIYAPPVQQFPGFYTGRYFYSDYCKGAIRMLDLNTGQDKGIFMTGGKRIIDLDVSHDGSMYYLERRGLADGSTEDNTGTNEGTLWKISYTGAGTPFISTQPTSLLVSQGEDAAFTVAASGANPLSYQWFNNGTEIDGATDETLLYEDAALSLDASQIHCEVRNPLGFILSDTVILQVTDNARPQAIIDLPLVNATYKAGDVLIFSGSGQDAEDGLLDESALQWRIDFHHGTHAHPALSWIQGMTGGEWTIPTVGETAADVWYRIYLKVTDSEGLSNIIFRDVYPQLGAIEVNTFPTGLHVNLDGAATVTPFVVEGVNGISRFITAPAKKNKGDSIYFFSHWNDGVADRNREIHASQEVQSFTAVYDGIAAGKGQGLTAYYFNNWALEGPPVDSLIDPVIDHQFFFNAPHPDIFKDYFSIRWEGYIQAYRDGAYTFSVLSDDGVRFSIGDQTLFDLWEEGQQYDTIVTFLKGGQLYPVRLEMFDSQWASQIRLRWSTDDFPQEVIPATQLYPVRFLSSDTISGFFSLQQISADEIILVTESYKEVELDITIYTMTGQVVSYPFEKMSIGKNITRINISNLPPGLYYMSGINHVTGENVMTPIVKVR